MIFAQLDGIGWAAKTEKWKASIKTVVLYCRITCSWLGKHLNSSLGTLSVTLFVDELICTIFINLIIMNAFTIKKWCYVDLHGEFSLCKFFHGDFTTSFAGLDKCSKKQNKTKFKHDLNCTKFTGFVSTVLYIYDKLWRILSLYFSVQFRTSMV